MQIQEHEVVAQPVQPLLHWGVDIWLMTLLEYKEKRVKEITSTYCGSVSYWIIIKHHTLVKLTKCLSSYWRYLCIKKSCLSKLLKSRCKCMKTLKLSPWFVEPGGSITSILSQINSTCHIETISLGSILIISSHLCLGIPIHLFPVCLTVKRWKFPYLLPFWLNSLLTAVF